MTSATLTRMGVLTVTNSDPASFLQGQLTCDVTALTDGEQCLGLYCNQQGRIVASFVLNKRDGRYHLIMPKEAIPLMTSSLEKYGMFNHIHCNDTSDAWQVVGHIGEETLLSLHPSSTPVKTSRREADWQHDQLSRKIPWIKAKTQTLFLPHHLQFHKLGAINFEKGCFLGQEIIARMHYLGQHKYVLAHVQFECDTQIEAGSKILFESRVIAEIVDVFKNEGLIVVKTHFLNHTSGHLNSTDGPTLTWAVLE